MRNNPLKYADPTGHELRFFQFPYYVYLDTGDPAWNRALNFNVLDPSDYMMKGNQLISALEGSAVNLGLMTETDVEGINFVSMMLGNEIGLSEQICPVLPYQAGPLDKKELYYVK